MSKDNSKKQKAGNDESIFDFNFDYLLPDDFFADLNFMNIDTMFGFDENYSIFKDEDNFLPILDKSIDTKNKPIKNRKKDKS